VGAAASGREEEDEEEEEEEQVCWGCTDSGSVRIMACPNAPSSLVNEEEEEEEEEGDMRACTIMKF
jgi:hypothetical protein